MYRNAKTVFFSLRTVLATGGVAPLFIIIPGSQRSREGIVSGSALLIDYMLTITVSIAACLPIVTPPDDRQEDVVLLPALNSSTFERQGHELVYI
jgi:hypothetical protein